MINAGTGCHLKIATIIIGINGTKTTYPFNCVSDAPYSSADQARNFFLLARP